MLCCVMYIFFLVWVCLLTIRQSQFVTCLRNHKGNLFFLIFGTPGRDNSSMLPSIIWALYTTNSRSLSGDMLGIMVGEHRSFRETVGSNVCWLKARVAFARAFVSLRCLDVLNEVTTYTEGCEAL